jgi:hypothetical protein
MKWCSHQKKKKKTPWSESASELYRPSDRRLSAKRLPTFADRGCHVVTQSFLKIRYVVLKLLLPEDGYTWTWQYHNLPLPNKINRFKTMTDISLHMYVQKLYFPENSGMFAICPHTEYTVSLSNSTKTAFKTPQRYNFTQSYSMKTQVTWV